MSYTVLKVKATRQPILIQAGLSKAVASALADACHEQRRSIPRDHHTYLSGVAHLVVTDSEAAEILTRGHVAPMFRAAHQAGSY